MNDKIFALLGILAPTKAKKENEAEKLLNALDTLLKKYLINKLSNLVFNNRKELIDELNSAISDARLISVYPELINRACIAIIYDDSAPWMDIRKAFKETGIQDIFKNAKMPEIIDESIKSIPVLFLPAVDLQGIGLADREGLPIDLGEFSVKPSENRFLMSDDGIATFLNLSGSGINPKTLISAITCHVPLKFDSTAYFFLPASELASNAFSPFLFQCDAALVLDGLPAHALDVLAENLAMPVYLLSVDKTANDKQKQKLLKYSPGRKVEKVSPGQLNSILKDLNGQVIHQTLLDRILSAYLWVVEAEMLAENEVSRLLQNLLNVSILHDYDEESAKFFNELKDNLSKKAENHLSKIRELKKGFDEIKQAISDWDDKIKASKDQKNDIPLVAPWLNAGKVRPESLWRRIIMRALVCSDMDLAATYQYKYNSLFPEHAFITGLYLKTKSKDTLTSKEQEKLRNLPDTPEALRAKLYFADALGLNSDDKANIANLLPNLVTPDEKFYNAVFLNKEYIFTQEDNIYKYSFIENLYQNHKSGLQFTAEELDKLRWLQDSPQALRAKIYFADQLNLTSMDLSNITTLLDGWYYYKCKSNVVSPVELEKYILPRHMCFLNELYKKFADAQDISEEEYEKLRNLPDSPQVFYAKKFFASALGLSKQDIKNINSLLYDWDAKHILDKDDRSRVDSHALIVDAYLQAAGSGNSEAADYLSIYFFEKNEKEQLGEIAQTGSPLGAYLFALLLAKQGEQAKSREWMTMAAALGSFEAQMSIAEAIWQEISSATSFIPAFAETEAMLTKGQTSPDPAWANYAKFYAGILSGSNKDLFPPEMTERLGIIYTLTDFLKDGREILYNSHTLPESMLVLALILKYGKAGRSHKEHAIRLLNSIPENSGAIYHRAFIIRDAWFRDELDALKVSLNYIWVRGM